MQLNTIKLQKQIITRNITFVYKLDRRQKYDTKEIT